MQGNANQENQGPAIAFGTIAFITRSMAATLEVFLHRSDTFGSRYFGFQSLAAVIILLLWPALCDPTHNPIPLNIFLVAYLFMVVVARVRSAVRVGRGEVHPHGRYSGLPRLRFGGRISEVKIKCLAEPALIWIIGGLFLQFSPPLGGYLMVAGTGMFISNTMADASVQRRAQDMHDAYVDQRDVMDRFHDMRRD